MIRRRSRFAKLAETQVDLVIRDHHDVFEEATTRLDAYNRADRADAEELYGDYRDALESGAELLGEVRDRYARTVDDPDAYVRAFNRAVARALPDHARELEAL